MTSWDAQVKWLIQDVPVDDVLVLVFKNSVKSKVQLTGIQASMLEDAPDIEDVIKDAVEFVHRQTLVQILK